MPASPSSTEMNLKKHSQKVAQQNRFLFILASSASAKTTATSASLMKQRHNMMNYHLTIWKRKKIAPMHKNKHHSNIVQYCTAILGLNCAPLYVSLSEKKNRTRLIFGAPKLFVTAFTSVTRESFLCWAGTFFVLRCDLFVLRW